MKSSISKSSITFSGPINNIHEAPVLGNGDLAALVQIFQNEFRLHLGKNDIWDARCPHENATSIYPHDKLIRASRDYGFRIEGPLYHGKPAWDRQPPPELEYPDEHATPPTIYPCPKPAGLIRVMHSGISSTRIATTLDIARGVIETRFDLDYDWHGTGSLIVTAFVERGFNRVRLRLRAEGQMGAVHLWLERPPDQLDATIPPCEVTVCDETHGRITQRFPAGYDVEAFDYHMAGAFPRSGDGRAVRPLEKQVYRVAQICSLRDGGSAEWCVGVATNRDSKGDSRGSIARAVALAGDDPAVEYDAALRRHEEAYDRFWSASAVELGDAELEKSWHRNLYALSCHLAPGAQLPGLCANVPVFDRSPWHGTYTVNMNVQKMMLASLPSNHSEWIDMYADWLDQMTPGFERLARVTFGIEGIYITHMVMPFVPPRRQTSSNTAGRALGMIGWMGQPLWWHWEYTRDRAFLEKRAYPFFRRAAEFYRQLFDKFMDESGDIYPSLILEYPEWTRGMARNRDCFTDLILIRSALRYAIEASEVLGVDSAMREGWRAALARVRPLRFERLPFGRAWIANDKGDAPPVDEGEYDTRRDEIALAAAWSIFPGEYADGDEAEADGFAAAARDIMRDTRWHTLHPRITWIHHWWCAIPALRMRLDNAFEQARKVILQERFPAGHARTTHWINLQPDAWRCPEENYLGVVATTEMLLQSQGRVLRLFPCWPRQMAARFRGLPARGGFIVDAAWDPGQGLEASIRSIAGEPCRVRWGGVVAVTSNGRPVPTRRNGDDTTFDTAPGATYELRSRI